MFIIRGCLVFELLGRQLRFRNHQHHFQYQIVVVCGKNSWQTMKHFIKWVGGSMNIVIDFHIPSPFHHKHLILLFGQQAKLEAKEKCIFPSRVCIIAPLSQSMYNIILMFFFYKIKDIWTSWQIKSKKFFK